MWKCQVLPGRLLLGLLLLAASLSNATAAETIKIGYLSSLSGPFTPWGVQVRDGMKMAVDELNAAGGVTGKKLELVLRDDKNNASEALTAFRYLTEQEGVVALGGVISSDVAIAVAREGEAQRIPTFLSMGGTEKSLTKASRYTFRVCLPAAPMSVDVAATLVKSRGYKRVGVITGDYAWGHSIRTALEREMGALPGVKLQIEVAPVSTRDFTPYLRKLQEFDSEIIIALGHPPGSLTIARQAIELGLKGQIIGGWFPTEFSVQTLGEQAFGRYVDYSCADFASPSYRNLAIRYNTRTGRFLDISAVSGYAIVKMVAQAIQALGTTAPDKIAEYVRTNVFNIDGFAWPISYTEWGEIRNATPVLYTFEREPGGETNPTANWRPKIVFRSEAVKPYAPEN